MKVIKIIIMSVLLPLIVSAQDKQEKKFSKFKSDTSKDGIKMKNNDSDKDQHQNNELSKKKKTETPNKLKNQPKKEVKEIKNTGNFKPNTKISKKKIGKTSK